MSAEWFGILLLGVLFVAIFIGFPIAFTLIAVAAIGGYAMLGPLALHLMTLQVFSVMRDPTLASVPFFLFMGFLLEQSGLMERLFRGIQLAFASVRGSLYLAVLVTATIFAAATGIVGSSVTLLGVMAAPAMKRSGYDIRMSAGAITAGGTHTDGLKAGGAAGWAQQFKTRDWTDAYNQDVLKDFIKELVATITDRPISFEVTSDDFAEMERQALDLHGFGDNVMVKIPVTDTSGARASAAASARVFHIPNSASPAFSSQVTWIPCTRSAPSRN